MKLLKKFDVYSFYTLLLFTFNHLATAGQLLRIKLEKDVRRGLEICGQHAECVSGSEFCSGVINSDVVKQQNCGLDHALSKGFCCPLNKVVRPKRQTKLTYEDEKSELDKILDSSETGPIELIPEDPECGWNSQSMSTTTSEQNAMASNWPWMAVLLQNTNKGAFCGGVLINKRFVLTAAHCFKIATKNDFVVRLGEYDLTKTNETNHMDYKVMNIRSHPDYDPATHANDISILKLSKSVVYNSFIRPICLPKINMDIYNNQSAVVAGWGRISADGVKSNFLLQVTVPVWDHDKCVAAFSQPISKTNICAAPIEGGKDSCRSDSGGPLMMKRSEGKWTNIGVVSWGIGCAEPGFPGVYTKVVSYLKWIAVNVQDVM